MSISGKPATTDDRVVKMPANPTAGLFGRRMTTPAKFPRSVDAGTTPRAA
ncbi:hypothetical protein [Erythrobacter sp. KY5]|nr:hypothetical protein [Erythrobacter sp. KY5]